MLYIMVNVYVFNKGIVYVLRFSIYKEFF